MSPSPAQPGRAALLKQSPQLYIEQIFQRKIVVSMKLVTEHNYARKGNGEEMKSGSGVEWKIRSCVTQGLRNVRSWLKYER